VHFVRAASKLTESVRFCDDLGACVDPEEKGVGLTRGNDIAVEEIWEAGRR